MSKASQDPLHPKRSVLLILAFIFSLIAVVLSALAFFDRTYFEIGENAISNLVDSPGKIAATRQYERLFAQDPSMPIKQLQECTSGSNRFYKTSFAGGLGSGETYIYNDAGQEVYYVLCGVLPADGCDLIEERGSYTELSQGECVSLKDEE